MLRGILPSSVQFFQLLFANERISFFETLFISDGGLLHELDIDRTPAAFITIEQGIRRISELDLVERVDQLHGVLDTTVETKAADRVVDMGGITCEKDPPGSELCRDPLMNFVQVAMGDVVGLA